MGLTPQGAVGVPTGPKTAAWFNQGPRPGEPGSAVIDGHFGWINSIPAIFDELHTLHAGDIVVVEDANGVATTFAVREFKTYGRTEEPPEVFTSSDGVAHLNLVTCQGVWSKARQSYSNRLVVFTDRVAG